jgi:hypothetical protein
MVMAMVPSVAVVRMGMPSLFADSRVRGAGKCELLEIPLEIISHSGDTASRNSGEFEVAEP